MKLAALLAILTAGRCWWTWDRFGYTMEPDFTLYTQGGLALFPSPLGRALGALGPTAFAALSALSAGLVVLLVAALARRHGGSARWSSILAATIPASLYLGYAGIDAIGLALLLAALVYAKPWIAVAAALTHLSLAPFALLLLPRASLAARVALAAFCALLLACLLLTPYSGVIFGAVQLDALYAVALGALAFALISFPAVAWARRNRFVTLAALIGLGECAVQAHLQARYLLPAAFLLAATAHHPAWLAKTLGGFRPPQYPGVLGEQTIGQSATAHGYGRWGAPPVPRNTKSATQETGLQGSGLPTFGGQRP